AGSAEQLSLDEGHCHAGAGQLSRQRRPSLAGADDDRIELFHGNATPISSAAPMATASSMKAAGRSLPNAFASRARKARPPRVPIIAPTVPAISPPIIAPPEAPTAAPESAPVATRAPNWTGTVRLGVDGS